MSCYPGVKFSYKDICSFVPLAYYRGSKCEHLGFSRRSFLMLKVNGMFEPYLGFHQSIQKIMGTTLKVCW
jgi:hypothetical protein